MIIITTELFIEKAKAVHGDKYDYSQVVYKNAREKVKIICRNHGVFLQSPMNHLGGNGCVLCWHSPKKLTTEEFITKAQQVHGEYYDYSLVNYTNSHTKVTIICPVHGIFTQAPSGHLSGNGCEKCGKRSTKAEFLSKALAVHGDRYDYSKTLYELADQKVTITCKAHGDFLQAPRSHVRGNGCPNCKNSAGENKISMILKYMNVHYVKEYSFDTCRNPETSRKLIFDFYLPNHNALIEFDGSPHFIPYSYTSDQSEEAKLSNLMGIQTRDKIKTSFAVENNIPLLRISYKEIKHIDTIVSNFINKLTK